LEKEKADLEAALEKEGADLEARVFELEWCQYKDCIGHGLGCKEIYDLHNQRVGRGHVAAPEHQQIVELEFENEKLKDQMAVMAMEGPVAGFGDELSAGEWAY
jgi:hypothetical protein